MGTTLCIYVWSICEVIHWKFMNYILCYPSMVHSHRKRMSANSAYFTGIKKTVVSSKECQWFAVKIDVSTGQKNFGNFCTN